MRRLQARSAQHASARSHEFKAVHLSRCGQHSGRVGSLASPRFQKLPVPTLFQEPVQQIGFLASTEQAGPELAQHAEVEPRIGQFQGEQILPVESTANGLGSLDFEDGKRVVVGSIAICLSASKNLSYLF